MILTISNKLYWLYSAVSNYTTLTKKCDKLFWLYSANIKSKDFSKKV